MLTHIKPSSVELKEEEERKGRAQLVCCFGFATQRELWMMCLRVVLVEMYRTIHELWWVFIELVVSCVYVTRLFKHTGIICHLSLERKGMTDTQARWSKADCCIFPFMYICVHWLIFFPWRIRVTCVKIVLINRDKEIQLEIHSKFRLCWKNHFIGEI